MNYTSNVDANDKVKNEVRKKVYVLLKLIGVDEDEIIVDFTIDKSIDYIKNYCNIEVLPPQIIFICADMVLADMLRMYKDSGKLESCNIDKITSIKEGDTQIDYGDCEDQSMRVERLISHLMHKEELIRFRRLAW